MPRKCRRNWKRAEPVIFPLALGRGFLYPEIKLAVISEADIYGVGRQKSHRPGTQRRKAGGFYRFESRRLRGARKPRHRPVYGHGAPRPSEGTYRDFLHIRYQGVGQTVRAHRSARPRAEIHRLRGRDAQAQPAFRRRMAAAEGAASRPPSRRLRGELLKLYAHREAMPGHAFDPDTPWQREFEDSFPYEETPDQLRRHRGHQARHGKAQDHGPAAVRRRGLRQDRGGAARHLQVPSWAASRRRCWRRPPFWCSSTTPP